MPVFGEYDPTLAPHRHKPIWVFCVVAKMVVMELNLLPGRAQGVCNHKTSEASV